MLQLKAKLLRMKYAGLPWTLQAVYGRGKKKVMGLPPFRQIVDKRFDTKCANWKERIEYGECPHGDLKARFIDEPGSRHFLEDLDETAAMVREQFPDHAAKTLEAAEATCRHEFHFLGKAVAFGEDIDWFWLPERDCSWPCLHADAYPKGLYYGPERPGDIKYPWELARHQYFVTLGKAYRYTGDERYAEAFTRQLMDFQQKNPLRVGIHWVSEMEFAIRIIAWSTAFQFFKPSRHFQEHGLEPFLEGLYQHALYLDKTLTTHWLVANNHLLGETAGLFVFATLFPHFPESRAWQRKSLRLFTQALTQQIHADGVNKEQATAYHRYVLDLLWLVALLAERNDADLPRVLYQRLEAMLTYEAALIPPTLEVPQVGDSDDGRGILLSEADSFFDFCGWLALGAVHFDRADFARSARGGNEEAAWVLGAAGWKQLQSIEPSPLPIASAYFPEGGHAILRTGDGPADTYVFVRCGEFGLGMDGSCVHSHADILAVAAVWRGHALAVDAGTYGYLCETDKRDSYRSVHAHNTVAPQGMDQAHMYPIWNWGIVPKTTVTVWQREEEMTRLEARCHVHRGYTHTRVIELASDPHRLTIEDELNMLDETAQAPIEWRLHLAPELRAVQEDSVVHIHKNATHLADLRFQGADSCTIEPAKYSPRYGVEIETQVIVLVAQGSRATFSVCIYDSDSKGTPS